MKHLTILLSLVLAISFNLQAQEHIEHLDAETFKKKVWDYTKNAKWKYEGNIPSIVDFYSDNCAPCKYVAPFLDELAKEYADQIKIYKVNVHKNHKLSRDLKVRYLPTLFFIKAKGKMKKKKGGMSKSKLEKEINKFMEVRK